MQCRVLDTTFRLVGDHFGIVGEDILMRDTIEGKQQWGDVEIAVIDILSMVQFCLHFIIATELSRFFILK